MNKQYDLKPCKNCGDITCSGQCNWLRPVKWLMVILSGFIMGWLIKTIIVNL
jgi:hypothetical protein